MILGPRTRTGKYSPTPPPVVAIPSQCHLPTGLDVAAEWVESFGLQNRPNNRQKTSPCKVNDTVVNSRFSFFLKPKTSRDLINKSSNFRVASFHALVQPKAPSSSSSPALHFTMTKQQANWSPYDNNGG